MLMILIWRWRYVNESRQMQCRVGETRMIDLRRYQELKKDVDRQQRLLDRAEGALEQLEERLKDEFGCDTIESAKKLLAKKEKESVAAGKAFEKSLEAFEEEWGE